MCFKYGSLMKQKHTQYLALRMQLPLVTTFIALNFVFLKSKFNSPWFWLDSPLSHPHTFYLVYQASTQVVFSNKLPPWTHSSFFPTLLSFFPTLTSIRFTLWPTSNTKNTMLTPKATFNFSSTPHFLQYASSFHKILFTPQSKSFYAKFLNMHMCWNKCVIWFDPKGKTSKKFQNQQW